MVPHRITVCTLVNPPVASSFTRDMLQLRRTSLLIIGSDSEADIIKDYRLISLLISGVDNATAPSGHIS